MYKGISGLKTTVIENICYSARDARDTTYIEQDNTYDTTYIAQPKRDVASQIKEYLCMKKEALNLC